MEREREKKRKGGRERERGGEIVRSRDYIRESGKSLFSLLNSFDVIFVLINVSSSPGQESPTWNLSSFNFSDKSRSADNKLRSKVNRLESWGAHALAQIVPSESFFRGVSSRDAVFH